jgi:hypothetical protein
MADPLLADLKAKLGIGETDPVLVPIRTTTTSSLPTSRGRPTSARCLPPSCDGEAARGRSEAREATQPPRPPC